MSELGFADSVRQQLESRWGAMSPRQAAQDALRTADENPTGFRILILSSALHAIANGEDTRSQSERVSRLEEALKDLARHSYQHGFLDATHRDGPPTDDEEKTTLKRIDSVAVHESFESLRDKFFLDAGVEP